MDKKEKVIRGLECCRQNTPDDPFQQCGACPYNINGIYVEDCRSVLSGDALEVLRPSGGGWISVKDRLPESGKPVLVTCEIHSLYGYKKQYVCEAYHAEAHSVSEGKGPEYTDCYDYFEEDDEYYLKEGWYEIIHNWDEYSSIVIDDFVTHWMPLPQLPLE